MNSIIASGPFWKVLGVSCEDTGVLKTSYLANLPITRLELLALNPSLLEQQIDQPRGASRVVRVHGSILFVCVVHVFVVAGVYRKLGGPDRSGQRGHVLN
jgi:hypothetical protein